MNENRKNAESVTCEACKNFAWELQYMYAEYFRGEYHHPSCPRLSSRVRDRLTGR
jgi:hypothetical protein